MMPTVPMLLDAMSEAGKPRRPDHFGPDGTQEGPGSRVLLICGLSVCHQPGVRGQHRPPYGEPVVTDDRHTVMWHRKATRNGGSSVTRGMTGSVRWRLREFSSSRAAAGAAGAPRTRSRVQTPRRGPLPPHRAPQRRGSNGRRSRSRGTRRMFSRISTPAIRGRTPCSPTTRHVNSIDRAILQGNADTAAMAFYSKELALGSAAKFVQGWVDDDAGWTARSDGSIARSPSGTTGRPWLSTAPTRARPTPRRRRRGRSTRRLRTRPVTSSTTPASRRMRQGVWQTVMSSPAVGPKVQAIAKPGRELSLCGGPWRGSLPGLAFAAEVGHGSGRRQGAGGRRRREIPQLLVAATSSTTTSKNRERGRGRTGDADRELDAARLLVRAEVHRRRGRRVTSLGYSDRSPNHTSTEDVQWVHDRYINGKPYKNFNIASRVKVIGGPPTTRPASPTSEPGRLHGAALLGRQGRLPLPR